MSQAGDKPEGRKGGKRRQVAALPWRGEGEDLRVLLVSSRETRRWVIPKGWPIKGLKPGPSAAQEALEEAGVCGEVSKAPLGVYYYDKRLKTGRMQHVKVAVYGLKVVEERASWPEMHEREKLWTSPADAAEKVDEPELRDLLRSFGA